MKIDQKHFHIHTAGETSLLHHFKKYAYVFFIYLFLFITFSVSAADIAAFSDSDFPIKQQNTAYSLKPDIWCSGVGEGFRAGTQVLDLTAGVAYGVLMFGGEERHHLSLISVSYGQMIGDVKGTDKWYRGNWELRVELFGGTQINSETCALFGVTPHLRYNFATGTRFVPYVDIGAGVILTGIHEGPYIGNFIYDQGKMSWVRAKKVGGDRSGRLAAQASRVRGCGALGQDQEDRQDGSACG